MHNLIKDLKARNLINNITNEEKLKKALAENKGIYVGFDPSADSLHLGNYIMTMLLKRFRLHNIKTFALVGGATGMIGDPSGKSAERNLLDKTILEHNITKIKYQLEKFTNSQVINNYDFYKNMTFLDFLRDVGKLINSNYLLEKEIISSRLDVGISYTEFSYNLLQGYDFLQLYKNDNIAIQAGGSDQWGNITTGIEIIRKSLGDDNIACGLTINLLTNSEGKKFGKSEKGAIYLDENKSSVYEMYQFLINQTDADVEKLLNFLTLIDVDEINKIMQAHKENPALRIAQKALAQAVVVDVHGQQKYEQALHISQVLFNGNINELNQEEFNIAIKSLPTTKLDKDEIKIIDLLNLANISSSNRVARDFLSTGSILVNDIKVNDENFLVKKQDAINQEFSIIKKGKRNYFLIVWNKD
ncbi:tyrosine--tRNA ligase [Ureaplasma urealyticum]|nr:tyrosine--tRNA ligase [Ureaplasma urealyticum]